MGAVVGPSVEGPLEVRRGSEDKSLPSRLFLPVDAASRWT